MFLEAAAEKPLRSVINICQTAKVCLLPSPSLMTFLCVGKCRKEKQIYGFSERFSLWIFRLSLSRFARSCFCTKERRMNELLI